MAVNWQAACDFVYSNGLLWERDLYAYLFQQGEVERLHGSLVAYQNADGGYGNALEPDARCPQSHPLALEFLLGVLVQHDIPPGNLLLGVSQWVEANMNPDGTLRNPPEFMAYPRAPWWQEGGQTAPDSIVGNLIKLGADSPILRDAAARWAAANLTEAHIRAVDWLFMAYHAHDYYLNLPDAPQALKTAVLQTLAKLAQAAPLEQIYVGMRFANAPGSIVTQAMPPTFINDALTYLEAAQQADGGWNDEHGLPQWRAYTTITNLLVLRRFGRV